MLPHDYTTGILQLMKSMPKDGRRDLVGGSRGGGGGAALIHHTFLKTPAAPWDVINVWSLNPLEGDFLLM